MRHFGEVLKEKMQHILCHNQHFINVAILFSLWSQPEIDKDNETIKGHLHIIIIFVIVFFDYKKKTVSFLRSAMAKILTNVDIFLVLINCDAIVIICCNPM